MATTAALHVNTCPVIGETLSITDGTFAHAGLHGMYSSYCGGGDGLSGSGDSTSAVAMMNISGRGAGDKCEEARRGGNMTERVHVPSSEHVAEIVGRQGCKIKALRSKTNTYIKTPARGEQSVFVLTGRKEDVSAAKREIISAADHFSQIRASRRHHNNNNSSSSTSSTTTTTTTTPRSNSRTLAPPTTGVTDRPISPGCGRSQVSIGVRVPDNVVGLVVGPKGATIKRIQQETNTYIVTPGRDKDPVFEVIGSKINVETARREIESYIETRVGGGSSSDLNDMDSPTDHKNSDADSKDSVFGDSGERCGADVFSSTFTAQSVAATYEVACNKNYYNSQPISLDSSLQRQPAVCGPYFPTTPSMTSWNPSVHYDCGNASSLYADLAGAAAVGIGNALKNKETWENLINESYQNYPAMYNNNHCDLQTLALSKRIAEYQRGLTNNCSDVGGEGFDLVSSAGQFTSLLDFSHELSGSLVNNSRDEFNKISKNFTEMGDSKEPIRSNNWSDMVYQHEEDIMTTRLVRQDIDRNVSHQFSSDGSSSNHLTAFSVMSLRQRRGGEALEDLTTGHRGSSCYSPSSSPTESSLSTGSTG